MNTSVRSTAKRIIINSDLDIVVARLRAREVAKEIGFGTIDQARISLAAGELARVLTRNSSSPGEIVISGIHTAGQLGIQVISLSPKGVASEPGNLSEIGPTSNAFSDESQLSGAMALVDETLVEDQGEQGTRVTLMKWLS
jgi:serine/threonine-protein kinase RsbT